MKTDNLDRLRVASPCPTSWEQMSGNERVRHCELCNLSVYNIAELTRKEAAALVSPPQAPAFKRHLNLAKEKSRSIARLIPAAIRFKLISLTLISSVRAHIM